MRSLIFLFVAVFFITSCGSKQTPTSLEVSHSFTMTNPNFGGGLLIYGESTTGKKFSMALDTTLKTTIPLEAGSWKFYAMGWDGDTFNYKFEGNKYCGKTFAEVSSTSASVSIQVSQNNCTNDIDFVNDIAPRTTATKACNAFYNYSFPTNTFTEVTTLATAGSFNCNFLPVSFQTDFKYYRVVAFDQNPGADPVPKYFSECKLFGATIDLPNRRIPLAVRAYKTLADCTAKVKHEGYQFSSGIESGGTDFEQKYFGSAGTSHLLIPTSITRRGTSPLMSHIPQFLCGGSGSYQDCMPNISTSTHVRVPWNSNDGGHDKQVLAFTGATATTCSGFAPSDDFFGFEGCEVDEGKLVGKVFRNQLTCQESGVYTNVKDIYQKNGKVYILKLVSVNFWVDVLTVDGKQIASYQLPGSSYVQARIAADSASNIYVAYYDGVNNRVDRHNFNGSNNYSAGPTFNVTPPTLDIEVNSAGTEVYLAHISGAFTYYVTPYDMSGSGGVNANLGAATDGSQSIQIKALGSTLYSMTTENTVQQMTIGTMSLGTPSPIVLTPVITNLVHMDATTGKLIFLTSTGDISMHDLSGNQLKTFNTSVGSPTGVAYYPSVGKMSVVGSSSLHAFNTTMVTPADITAIGTDCSSSMSILGKVLNLKSMKDDSYDIMNSALKIFGLRQVTTEHPRYLFEELGHDNDLSGGGILRRAQEHMSPLALGGILGKYSNTCNGLVTVADSYTGDQINDTSSVFDREENRTITISTTIKKVSTLMTNLYFCVPADPGASSCLNTFDLDITFNITHSDRTEVMKMKIDCDSKIGRFETKEIETTRTERNILEWSLSDDTNARFEEHKLEIEGSRVSASLSKVSLMGTISDVWAREVHFGFESSNAYGSTLELNRTGGVLGSASENIQDLNVSAFFANSDSSFQLKRADTTFFNVSPGSATSCMTTGTSDPFTTNLPSCDMGIAGPTPAMSTGLQMKIDVFGDLSGGTAALPASTIRGVFTIP